jgi:hypothetical protein
MEPRVPTQNQVEAANRLSQGLSSSQLSGLNAGAQTRRQQAIASLQQSRHNRLTMQVCLGLIWHSLFA